MYIIIALFLIFDFSKLSLEEKERFITESEVVLNKAISLKDKFWGISFYFDFLWFYSKRGEKTYKTLNLDSIEFQKYLIDQYSMFRLRKSCIFLKVSEICYDILKNQLDPNYTQFIALSQHCAMAVIRTLNNNLKSKNRINAEATLNEFYNIYGDTNLVPSNIYQVLVEKKILNLKDGFFSYVNPGVFNYYFLFSKDLMPIFKETSEDIEETISNFEAYSLMCVLDDTEFIDVEYFVNYNNFNKFRDMLKDWSDPEQYFDFENSDMQEFYCFQTDRKILYNDKLFHSLLINQIGLTSYYFNPKTKLDNIYYYINTQDEI